MEQQKQEMGHDVIEPTSPNRNVLYMSAAVSDKRINRVFIGAV